MAVEYINAVYALPPGSASATEIAILAYLANRANAEGRCWPKRSTIAAACQLHPDTVKASLGALAERGLIGKRNRIVDGRIISADVVLLFEPLHLDRRGSGAEPRVGGPVLGGGGSRTPNKNHQEPTYPEPIGSSRANASAQGGLDLDGEAKPPAPAPSKKPRKAKPKPPPLDLVAFERFWELYPRKVAKAEAQKSFAKACAKITGPEPPAEVMIAALARVIPIWQRREIENVPHATTWLNQERWNDEHGNPAGPGGPGSPAPNPGRPRTERDSRVEQMLSGALAALNRGG